MQGEYRRILEAGEGDTTQLGESPSVTVTADDVPAYIETLANMGDVGELVANEIQHGGKPAVEAMMQAARELENTLGEEVTTAFYGLLDNVQAAIYGKLSRAYTPRVPNASAADLAKFSQVSAGRILVPEWSQDTARKLAVVLYR